MIGGLFVVIIMMTCFFAFGNLIFKYSETISFLREPEIILNPKIYARNMSKDEISNQIMMLSKLASGTIVYVSSFSPDVYAVMCSERLLNTLVSPGEFSKPFCSRTIRGESEIPKIIKSWIEYKNSLNSEKQ